MSNPQDSRVGVIRIEGTNCEDESAQAFSSLGCEVEKGSSKTISTRGRAFKLPEFKRLRCVVFPRRF